VISRIPYEFTEALVGDRDAASLLPRLARGIGRSDGLSGAVLDAGLCLRLAHSDVNRLTVLKRFALAEFSLTVPPPIAADIVGALPRLLVLAHTQTNARLDITLDLFELLLRLADGLEPGSPELQPLLEDLAPFKSAVQLSNTRDLILVESGRRLHELTQRDGKVVRTALQPEATA